MPLADGLRTTEQLKDQDPAFPLEVAFCPNCSLVQILETVPPEQLFSTDYPYFSASPIICSPTPARTRST